MVKRQDIYRGFLDYWADEFSHKYACWAYNHRGWAKSKKSRRRWAKKRERRAIERIIEDGISDYQRTKEPS